MAISTIERNKPPYQVVYEYFRKRTESAGDGMLIPPRSKLAEQFNVAEGTITRAVDLLKKRGFAYGQQGRGTYLCDRRQKSSKLQQIGFYTYQVEFDTVRYLRGFDRVFTDGDYSLSIHSSQMNIKKYKDVIEHIENRGLSCVILQNIPSLNGLKRSIDTSFLIEAGIPVVVMGGVWQGLHCDTVEHSRRDSARRMAEYAIAGGCQKPGVFLPSEGANDEDSAEFLDELNYVFQDHNIEIKREHIFYYDASFSVPDDLNVPMDTYRFTEKELSGISQCDAMMLPGDGIATAVSRALCENGIKVPEQIKLLSGYQGVIPEAIRENLTSVNTNMEEQARMAAVLLKRRLEGYDGPMQSHYVSGELIEGNTA